jgi:O-antigen/teichoic acid export membrane protein
MLRAYNVSRASIHLLNAAGALLLLAAGVRSVYYFAAVTLFGNLAGWVIAAAYGPWRRMAAASPSADTARSLFRYGFRVQVGNWSNAASVRLDQLLLSLLAPASSLGLYVVAVTYANVLQTIPGSAAMVMLPEIVRANAAGTAGVCAERWYRRALWTTVVGGAVLAATAMILVPLLFGSAFADAIPIVMVLIPATIVLGMNQLLVAAFRGVGRPGIGSRSELIGVIVTVLALAALLPRYGALGAAVASLAAYSSSHVYLLRQIGSIRVGGAKSLYALTRDDISALRGAITRRPS